MEGSEEEIRGRKETRTGRGGETKELAEQQREAERRAKERAKERAKAINISDSTIKWPVEDIYPDRKMPKALLFLRCLCVWVISVYVVNRGA